MGKQMGKGLAPMGNKPIWSFLLAKITKMVVFASKNDQIGLFPRGGIPRRFGFMPNWHYLLAKRTNLVVFARKTNH